MMVTAGCVASKVMSARKISAVASPQVASAKESATARTGGGPPPTGKLADMGNCAAHTKSNHKKGFLYSMHDTRWPSWEVAQNGQGAVHCRAQEPKTVMT